MQIGYYPGCSLHASSKEYDISLREIAGPLGLELMEFEDWNCCGASAAHNTNELLAVALPARNLALAEAAGLKEVLAPCAACSSRLITAHKKMAEDSKLKAKVEEVIEMPYNLSVSVYNLLQVFSKYCMEELDKKATKKLEGLKVACYYGCLLLRPPKILEFDDAEQPETMEKIVTSIGGEPVDWAFKTECCGGGFAMSRTDVVVKLCHQILDDAAANGAQVILVGCPLCQVNLDMRQAAVEKKYGKDYNIPIVYISQLIGIAMGFGPSELGMGRHFVSSSEVFSGK